ncbi:hypothetical protein [Paraliobacillus ryukyuensis]|uniref:hypothetical protein n=1 Tax=Paraliobacillus ryukyuensis TaxID=200904 RepID=UPI0009A794AA|nr:hypothetical protein [Paraliobacillus ryukyuensis]
MENNTLKKELEFMSRQELIDLILKYKEYQDTTTEQFPEASLLASLNIKEYFDYYIIPLS